MSHWQNLIANHQTLKSYFLFIIAVLPAVCDKEMCVLLFFLTEGAVTGKRFSWAFLLMYPCFSVSPMVGIVVTISPSFSLYRIVVFPAASRPTMRMRISVLPKRPLNIVWNKFPILAALVTCATGRKENRTHWSIRTPAAIKPQANMCCKCVNKDLAFTISKHSNILLPLSAQYINGLVQTCNSNALTMIQWSLVRTNNNFYIFL